MTLRPAELVRVVAVWLEGHSVARRTKEGILIYCVVNKLTCRIIEVVAELENLIGGEGVVDSYIELHAAILILSIGQKADVVVEDTYTALRKDVAILKLLTRWHSKVFGNKLHIWLCHNNYRDGIITLLEVWREEDLYWCIAVDRLCDLLAIDKYRIVGANILDVEICTEVVPRSGNVNNLLIDCTNSTRVLKEELWAEVDIFVDIVADVLLGIIALVVADKFGASDTCLS